MVNSSAGSGQEQSPTPTPPIHSGDEDKVEASTEQKAGAGSQALQQSSTQAEPDRPWACLHCPKAYKTRADLNKHNRNSICGKKHNSGNVLPPPARVKVSMDWTCPRCGSILISKYSAERHIANSCWKICDQCAAAGSLEHERCAARTALSSDCSRCLTHGLVCIKHTGPVDGCTPQQVPKSTQEQQQPTTIDEGEDNRKRPASSSPEPSSALISCSARKQRVERGSPEVIERESRFGSLGSKPFSDRIFSGNSIYPPPRLGARSDNNYYQGTLDPFAHIDPPQEVQTPGMNPSTRYQVQATNSSLYSRISTSQPCTNFPNTMIGTRTAGLPYRHPYEEVTPQEQRMIGTLVTPSSHVPRPPALHLQLQSSPQAISSVSPSPNYSQSMNLDHNIGYYGGLAESGTGHFPTRDLTYYSKTPLSNPNMPLSKAHEQPGKQRREQSIGSICSGHHTGYQQPSQHYYPFGGPHIGHQGGMPEMFQVPVLRSNDPYTHVVQPRPLPSQPPLPFQQPNIPTGQLFGQPPGSRPSDPANIPLANPYLMTAVQRSQNTPEAFKQPESPQNRFGGDGQFSPRENTCAQDARHHNKDGTLTSSNQMHSDQSSADSQGQDRNHIDPRTNDEPTFDRQTTSDNQPSTSHSTTAINTPSDMSPPARAGHNIPRCVSTNSEVHPRVSAPPVDNSRNDIPTTQETIRSSHPLTAHPNDPVLNLRLVDISRDANSRPLTYTPFAIRMSQKFGPHLVAYCEARGKRFRYEWNFVFWFKNPTAHDPTNETGVVIHWNMTPAYFLGSPIVAARMKDGDIIEVMESSNPAIAGTDSLAFHPGEAAALANNMLNYKDFRMNQLGRKYQELRAMTEGTRQENEQLRKENTELKRQLAELKGTPNPPPPEGDANHDTGGVKTTDAQEATSQDLAASTNAAEDAAKDDKDTDHKATPPPEDIHKM